MFTNKKIPSKNEVIILLQRAEIIVLRKYCNNIPNEQIIKEIKKEILPYNYDKLIEFLTIKKPFKKTK